MQAPGLIGHILRAVHVPALLLEVHCGRIHQTALAARVPVTRQAADKAARVAGADAAPLPVAVPAVDTVVAPAGKAEAGFVDAHHRNVAAVRLTRHSL